MRDQRDGPYSFFKITVHNCHICTKSLIIFFTEKKKSYNVN